MLIPLSKRIKDILQHYEDHEMLPYLHVLEKYLLKLETIVAAYQRTLFPISRQTARDHITQQVNLISCLFKALGSPERLYPAWVDLAQKEVLQAYRATMDEEREKERLVYSFDIKTWENCITTILSLNTIKHRPYLFVEHLKLFEKCEAYVLPIQGPSRWTLLAGELKQHADELKQDLTLMGDWCARAVSSFWNVFRSIVKNSTQFIKQQLAVWSQAISEKYAQWTAKPEEPPFPEGYYKAPPISDQQVGMWSGMLSAVYLWSAETERNVINAARSAKKGMENYMNKEDNDLATRFEPGTLIYSQNPLSGSVEKESFLSSKRNE